MPTSWSIAAAHSSSRSPGAGSNSPAATSESCICKREPGDVLGRAPCPTRTGSRGCARPPRARSRTAARRRRAASSARNTPSRRPASVDLDARRSGPSSSTVSSVSAAARMMSPRPGLIPGTSRARTPAATPASGRARRHHLARDHEALDADVERSARHRWAAAARLRAAPPIPTSRVARARAASRRRPATRGRMRARAGGPSSSPGPEPVQKLLGHAHGAERERHQRRRPAGPRPRSAACCRRRCRPRRRRSASRC